MSGSIDNYWAMSEKNEHLNVAFDIAKSLGQPQESFEGLIKFLLSIEANELSKYSRINSTQGRLEMNVLPVIESTLL